MILSDVKAYVKEHGRVSVRDTALRFDVSEAVARDMLDHWARKKILRREEERMCSRACASCALKCGSFYVYIGG